MLEFFGNILTTIYDLFPNYALAIIVFTCLVMIVLTPVTLKQTRSMLAMQKVAPELKKLRKKHGNDRDRLNQEMMARGLAVWHPKGASIRKLMEDYSRKRHEDGDYKFVYTPHLANAELFKTSGHLDFYSEGMYPPMEMDNGEYYPKPMNCPMHCLIYKAGTKSYRDLPLRLFELGTVYRYERAGTLHGLRRIRGFPQDDSHIFTT